MAGDYAGFSDTDLLAERDQYLAARKKLALGGNLAVIAGEGRRKEVTQANNGLIASALREINAEIARRPSISDGSSGGALVIEFNTRGASGVYYGG